MRYADSYCIYSEEFVNGEHYYVFTGPCIQTGKSYSVRVKGPDLYKYRKGAFIQNAFPYLSASDREFLMSGYSPEGWQEVFGKETEK